jgi:aldehyde dehydrogenase (NAD+)
VRPTVFANVTPDMRIAREEIFGPVLSILPYDSVEQAIGEANDTVYGLASYIQTKDIDKAREVAIRRMRTGNVHINYPAWDAGMPFGGYKQSGNGREYAEYGLDDFLATRSRASYGLGYEPARPALAPFPPLGQRSGPAPSRCRPSRFPATPRPCG